MRKRGHFEGLHLRVHESRLAEDALRLHSEWAAGQSAARLMKDLGHLQWLADWLLACMSSAHPLVAFQPQASSSPRCIVQNSPTLFHSAHQHDMIMIGHAMIRAQAVSEMITFKLLELHLNACIEASRE